MDKSVLQRARRVVHRVVRRARAARTRAEDTVSGTSYALAEDRQSAADVFLVPPTGIDVGVLPAWILEAAAKNRVELTSHRWTILPARGYRSQKVTFLTIPERDASFPEGVAVKVTQLPEYGSRLVNEYRGLRALEGVTAAKTTPRALFRAEHRGLTIVGETRLSGVPFRTRSDASIDCPWAARTLEWIEQLGDATSKPTSSTEWSDAMAKMTDRFREIYQPSITVAQWLDQRVEALSTCGPLPSVFYHGDLGTWNLLTNSQGIAVLDWENAEPEGPPLWDLFNFAHTFGSFVGERAGLRDTPRLFSRQFLHDSPFSRLLREQVERHRQRLTLPAEAVRPLFDLHWVALATREAWRLTAARVAKGRYFRIVQALATTPDPSA